MTTKPTKEPKEPEFSKIMELWVPTDLKVQVLVCYHDNPGTIDTMEGLATRLGTNPKQLKKEMAGHVALGLVQEKKANGHTILVFDRKREAEVQQAIQEHFLKLLKNQEGKP